MNEGTPQAWLDGFKDPQREALVAEALANNAELERATAALGQSIAEALGISEANLTPQQRLALGLSENTAAIR